jgi:tRNA (guanine37-N1)-methyltransferase
MVFDVITLFPEMFAGPLDYSIIKRAQEKKLIEINLHNLRQWAIDKHGTVDDRPYGGGAGMILRVEPIHAALREIKMQNAKAKTTKQNAKTQTILLDPRGGKFTQAKARQYTQLNQLILICGHYEGVDERVREHLVNESISIGDYILTGGEIPAMVVIDAVSRLIPGVLQRPEATQIESFSTTSREPRATSYLEFPQYTRPANFLGWKVPAVLLSGNHGEIERWRESCYAGSVHGHKNSRRETT